MRPRLDRRSERSPGRLADLSTPFPARLSAKPEEEILAGEGGDDAGRKRKRIAVDDGKPGKKGKAAAEPSAIAEDDFFGAGSDSE